MSTRAIHLNAVRLGDRIPVLNGTLVAAEDTPKGRRLIVHKPNGRYASRWFPASKPIVITDNRRN